ncbi:hypothetical protein THASP1DRAFT_24162 [Thamnocephalis sphaerospora]|uniref:Galactose oxidase n=1 Tax=Thamnocephalis sphaerospora TaxID=78915 RepID=A0A4V1IWJ0_9FUNG|nr:hypothetical protein THASP1DRAFT_24162 [Thamnocephalis sphaerospora]|eukprot:RKP07729.1 hypothetical protein THASP1DRAFT_24162 [Thamnocephalis sphaerospora]
MLLSRHLLPLLLVLSLAGLPAAKAQKGKLLPRWGHSATVLDNRLYVIGGRQGEGGGAAPFANSSNLVISLDLTQAFETQSPPWITIRPASSMPPPMVNHIAAADHKNSQVIVYGGATTNFTQPTSLWTFRPETGTWNSTRPLDGPSRRLYNMGAAVVDGSMCSFGGTSDFSTMGRNASTTQSNELYALNIEQQTWTKGPSPSGNFSMRSQHTLSFVKDSSQLFVIGGISGNKMAPMDSILVYDLRKGQWSNKSAGGIVPSVRLQHTAVVMGNKIIVFGGSDETYRNIYNDVAILDTATMTWSRPLLESTPAGRYDHTATIVGDYMIVTFGFLGGKAGDSGLYVLNTKTWAFESKFPGVSNSSASSAKADVAEAEDSGLSRPIIAVIVFGSITLFATIAFFIFWRKRRQQQTKQQANNRAPADLEEPKASMDQMDAKNTVLYDLDSAIGKCHGSSDTLPNPPNALAVYGTVATSATFSQASTLMNPLTPPLAAPKLVVDNHAPGPDGMPEPPQAQLPTLFTPSDQRVSAMSEAPTVDSTIYDLSPTPHNTRIANVSMISSSFGSELRPDSWQTSSTRPHSHPHPPSLPSLTTIIDSSMVSVSEEAADKGNK